MKEMLARSKILFPIVIVLFVSGCSYGISSTQPQALQPKPPMNCAKFASDFTMEEKAYCGGSK